MKHPLRALPVAFLLLCACQVQPAEVPTAMPTLTVKQEQLTSAYYTSELQIPVIGGLDPALLADINGQLEALVAHYKDAFVAEHNVLPVDGMGKSELEVSVTSSSLTPKMVSIALQVWVYPSGAAHGNNGHEVFLYDIAKKATIKESELFAKGKSKRDLKPALVSALSLYEDQGLKLEDKEWIETGAGSGSLNVQSDGLHVIYAPYVVAPYSMGNVEVTLPWNDLGDILAPRALDLVR